MPSPSTDPGHNILTRLQGLHPIHRELLQRHVARAEMSGVKGGAFNEVDWDATIELVKASVRILIRRLELEFSEDFWKGTRVAVDDRCAYIEWLQWNVTPLPTDVLDGLYRDPEHHRVTCQQFCDNATYDRALAAESARFEAAKATKQ